MKYKTMMELGLLGILAALWGSSYLLIKVAVQEIPPFTLIASRVFIAFLLLRAVMWLRGEHFPRERQSWQRLFVQSFFNSIASWTILAWAQQFVNSGLAGVLNSTSPIFVFLVSIGTVGHERVTPREVTGLLLGICGVILVIGVDSFNTLGEEVAAQLVILLGAVLYAGAALHGKRLSHLSPLVVAAGTMLWAVLFLVPLSFMIDQPWLLQPSQPALLATIGLGVFCTGIALLIYFRLVRTLGSMGVASQSYLRAGVSVLLGTWLLGEQFTPLVALGLFAIIAGVLLINLPHKHK